MINPDKQRVGLCVCVCVWSFKWKRKESNGIWFHPYRLVKVAAVTAVAAKEEANHWP